MKKTSLCPLLEIEHPVIQGGMLWLADACLAAVVSNSGALGVISPLAGMKKGGEPFDNLKNQIQRTKKLTQKPFGVNLPLDLPYIGTLIDVVLKEGIKIVITAAGDPADYSALFKQQGFTFLHVVSNVQKAQIAESCGVHAVIAEGVEAAAHTGSDELPLFSLIPQVSDAVSIPVVAAGGIVDSRGMVAAHMNYKNTILAASDSDTLITGRKLMPTRSLKTQFTKLLAKLEKSSADRREHMEFIGYRSNQKAQVLGNGHT